jgi:hypothetical protein
MSLSLSLALETSMGTRKSHKSDWPNVISYEDTTIVQDLPDGYASLMEVSQ